MQKKEAFFHFSLCLVASLSLAGCEAMSGISSAGVGAADKQQQVAVPTYEVGKPFDRTFSAASQAMVEFGQVLVSDHSSGTVQGQRGNWVVSAIVTQINKNESKVQLSARYAPSSRFDFNSKDDLLAEYVNLVNSKLGAKLQIQR
jgi:hypothetical protein